jgi:hypothetical protein
MIGTGAAPLPEMIGTPSTLHLRRAEHPPAARHRPNNRVMIPRAMPSFVRHQLSVADLGVKSNGSAKC